MDSFIGDFGNYSTLVDFIELDFLQSDIFCGTTEKKSRTLKNFQTKRSEIKNGSSLSFFFFISRFFLKKSPFEVFQFPIEISAAFETERNDVTLR